MANGKFAEAIVYMSGHSSGRVSSIISWLNFSEVVQNSGQVTDRAWQSDFLPADQPPLCTTSLFLRSRPAF